MNDLPPKEIRRVDARTLILWTPVGQNMFAFSYGTKLSREVYAKAAAYERGFRGEFADIDALYDWALSVLHPNMP